MESFASQAAIPVAKTQIPQLVFRHAVLGAIATLLVQHAYLHVRRRAGRVRRPALIVRGTRLLEVAEIVNQGSA
jgi:hypothetical protein